MDRTAIMGRLRAANARVQQAGRTLRALEWSAQQAWQAVSEAQGRGRGEREVTIVFTDLVGFSSGARDAGDEAAVELLRAMTDTIEPIVEARDGRVVKRLGDGMMAVFDDPRAAVQAALAATDAIAQVQVA